jgi:hypothetical protein
MSSTRHASGFRFLSLCLRELLLRGFIWEVMDTMCEALGILYSVKKVNDFPFPSPDVTDLFYSVEL